MASETRDNHFGDFVNLPDHKYYTYIEILYIYRNIEQDVDYVDQPDHDYFCPVSLELLTQPQQTSCCGNHISQEAADRLIRERKPCPMCKKDNFAAHEDLYFKRKVRQLKVYCLNKESGCKWTGELGNLNQHTTSCPKRPWKCPSCPFQSTHDIGTTDHAPHCDYHPVPCPNHCQVDTVPRCHLEKHLLICPLQPVNCQFASAGCDVKVPRKDLASHMAENTQKHLITVTFLNLQLTRDLNQKIEKNNQQIVQLQTRLQQLDVKVQQIDMKLYQLDENVTKMNKDSEQGATVPYQAVNQYPPSLQTPYVPKIPSRRNLCISYTWLLLQRI